MTPVTRAGVFRRAALVTMLGAPLISCESGLRGEDPNAARAKAPPLFDAAPAEPLPELPPGAAANAERVVASLRGALRDCYEAALRRDARAEGFTTLEVSLDARGHVADASPSGTFGLDARTTECMAAVLRPAVFDSPGPRGAKLNVPLRFMPSERPPASAAAREGGAP